MESISRARFDAAFKKLRLEIETLKAFGTANSNPLETRPEIKKLAESLAGLKASSPWNPSMDVKRPETLYGIVNETIRKMRSPASPIWVLHLCECVFNFISEGYPESEADLKTEKFSTNGDKLLEARKKFAQWKPIIDLCKRVNKNSLSYIILWTLVNSPIAVIEEGARSKQISELVELLANGFTVKASASKGLQLPANEAAITLIEIIELNGQIRKEATERLKGDKKFLAELLDHFRVQPEANLEWFSNFIHSGKLILLTFSWRAEAIRQN